MPTALTSICKILRQQDKVVTFLDQRNKVGELVEQVAPLGGIRSLKSFTLKWVGLSIVEKEELRGILDTAGTWGTLTFTPFGEANPVVVRATTGYSLALENNLFTIACEFRMVEV